MRQGDDEPLDVATRAMRGMLRYRNTDVVRITAMLVQGLDDAARLIEADLATLGAMVLVDPDFEQAWNDRMALRKSTLESIRARVDLVRAASAQANRELNPQEPASEQRPRSGSGHQGPHQPS